MKEGSIDDFGMKSGSINPKTGMIEIDLSKRMPPYEMMEKARKESNKMVRKLAEVQPMDAKASGWFRWCMSTAGIKPPPRQNEDW